MISDHSCPVKFCILWVHLREIIHRWRGIRVAPIGLPWFLQNQDSVLIMEKKKEKENFEIR